MRGKKVYVLQIEQVVDYVNLQNISLKKFKKFCRNNFG